MFLLTGGTAVVNVSYSTAILPLCSAWYYCWDALCCISAHYVANALCCNPFSVLAQDTCMGVLSASHDMHIGRILKREDEARGVETRRFQETMARYVLCALYKTFVRCAVCCDGANFVLRSLLDYWKTRRLCFVQIL
jgi:hypothetical protein